MNLSEFVAPNLSSEAKEIVIKSFNDARTEQERIIKQNEKLN